MEDQRKRRKPTRRKAPKAGPSVIDVVEAKMNANGKHDVAIAFAVGIAITYGTVLSMI